MHLLFYLQRKYAKNVPLLRSYAAFLNDVQNEPRKARKFLLEADRIEEAEEEMKKEKSFGGGVNDGTVTEFDEKLDAIIVISDTVSRNTYL